VSDVVLDASVFLKWFHTKEKPRVEEAKRLEARFEAGELNVLVPSLLWLEVLNVAARRLRWRREQLERLAARLGALGFVVIEPQLGHVAQWAGVGLTAYDAAYVAVAEQTGAQVITDDAQLVRQACGLAVALSEQVNGDDADES
jgi:predicted nucleic acid-binding protein